MRKLMNEDEKKIPVGCRMSPYLKEELMEEAENNEMTLSAYIEMLLASRVYIFDYLEMQSLRKNTLQNKRFIASYRGA